MPKPKNIRLLCEAKAKDLASEAKDYSFKAKDAISWPQGHGLEDSISDISLPVLKVMMTPS